MPDLMVASMKVLNVGGGPTRQLPKEYEGWHQDLLDIDPEVCPDIVCDARQMATLPASQYDAVFCSHTLEHFYRHEIPQVLAGFLHVLQPDGFAHIIVPDMAALFEAVVEGKRDIRDIWYVSPDGPIAFHDVIYGWGRQVEMGNLYYCHKTGFTAKSLADAVTRAGFRQVVMMKDGYNLYAFCFKAKATDAQVETLGLDHAYLS